MRKCLFKFVVLVAVMLVSVTAISAPFDDNYVIENTNSTLFSADIDINKFGNNLQKRNIQVKKVDYSYSQRAEQVHYRTIVKGAERVSEISSQVSLQNNVYTGYTRTGGVATMAQNVTFNRPMTIDAYATRTSVSEVFSEDVVVTENMQKVGDEDIYGGGAQPGPITDVVWGFLLCALFYVMVRCGYRR